MNTELHTHVELEWRTSFSASCLHAAEALALGRVVVEPRMADACSVAAQELRRAIRASGLPGRRLWRHLVPLACTIDSNLDLAQLAVRKTMGNGERADSISRQLAGCIGELEQTVLRALPDMADEVLLRGRLLREQWEARGPGLLREVARATDARVLVPQADVFLLYPSLGGAGTAHLPYNTVRIEAVLANPVAELPEVVRLAWLLSQLNLELPEFSDAIHGDRLPHVAELAMLPPVLQAAEHVELVQFSPATIDLALKAWAVNTPADVDPVDIVTRWWETFLQTRPRWDVALTALDRMFG